MKTLDQLLDLVFQNTKIYQNKTLEQQFEAANQTNDLLMIHALAYQNPKLCLPVFSLYQEVIELWLTVYTSEFEDSSKTLISFFNLTDPHNQKYILNEKIRLGKDAGKSVLWYLAHQALVTGDSLILLNIILNLTEEWSSFDLTAYGDINGERVTTADLLQKLCDLKLLPSLEPLINMPQVKVFVPSFAGGQILEADREASNQEEARNKKTLGYYN